MKKTSSPYIKVKKSSIHSKGVFAKKNIPKGTEIIEYVGDKVTKKEAEKRADIVLEKSARSKTTGAVYLFELNKKYDIDGYVPWNTARLINHSCNPNCETINIRGHIWIVALRDIKRGEELSYDYGYDFENFKDHPCKCGAKECIGYIVKKKFRAKLKKILKLKRQKK